MQLTETMQRYIVHWGEMGSRWGMNRSVAQIHALLYLAEKPLNADEIGETLGIARSNVSTGLKELTSWELVPTFKSALKRAVVLVWMPTFSCWREVKPEAVTVIR